MSLFEADLWSQLPIDLPALLALLPRADLYRASMRCRWPFIRRSRASGVAKGDVGSAWLKRLERIRGSMALAWSTGVMAGSMAESLRDVRLMCDAEQVRAAVVRSKERGRVRHIGSPFAPDKDHDAPLSLAQAA
jgi:hypothetical protein